MTRLSIAKRIKAAEANTKETTHARAEAEAREVTPERLHEIMLAVDAAQREHGAGPAATDYTKYIKNLTGGELLRLHRDRDQWAREQAKHITPEHIAELEATGIGLDRWTEAELHAVLGDDGIDWGRLPDDVLDSIAEDPSQVDFEDLARRYPKSRGGAMRKEINQHSTTDDGRTKKGGFTHDKSSDRI